MSSTRSAEIDTTSADSNGSGTAAAVAPFECVPKEVREHIHEQLDKLMVPFENNGTEFGLEGWVRSKVGGLRCADEELLARQKGVLTDVIKAAGSNLLQGKSIVNISLPVRIFAPKSFLQRIPETWCYAPIFLTRAALADSALERFKWTVAFAVSGLVRACTNLKPFNPILGETFQAAYSDGTQIALEQISHHPPVSSFELLGPHRIFHMHGFHEFAASIRPNSVIGQQIGPNCVEFLDGTVITFNMPYALMQGTMMGERNFSWQGTMNFGDPKNNLYLDLAFNPEKKSGLASLFSSQKSPQDFVRGDVYSLVPADDTAAEPVPKIIGRCQGSWMDGIEFDGKPYWKYGEHGAFEPIAQESPLPSDSRFREDLIALLSGDMEKAQQLKQELEDRQRAERDMRTQHVKLMSKHAKAKQKEEKKALKEEKKALKEEARTASAKPSVC